MAVLAPRYHGSKSGFHPLEVFPATLEVAAVARPITCPLAEVPAFGTGALQVDVVSRACQECREPLSTRYARPESLSEGRILNAELTLTSIQFVGSRLALMEYETGVGLRPVGAVGLGNELLQLGKVRPMGAARGRIALTGTSNGVWGTGG